MLRQRIRASNLGALGTGGLVGVTGGARVRTMRAGKSRIQMPVPQCNAGQVPVAFAITAAPAATVTGYRLRSQRGTRAVLEVSLDSKRAEEVQFEWVAIVLLADGANEATAADAEPFRDASACVQSTDPAVHAVAEKVWPADGHVAICARNLQEFVRTMQPLTRPKSLDAVGMLASGANTICTANANLAAAVLRQRGVPVRMLAVVPPNDQRLEMHRIVEWHADGAWHRFDPSSVSADIPMRNVQSVVMAETDMADEAAAMQLRMGAMPGCPLGQELEMLEGQVAPWGQDMFWTQAKPVAAFAVAAEVLASARASWLLTLSSGLITPAQDRAAAATTSAAIGAALATR
jgi:hypothetical protein